MSAGSADSLADAIARHQAGDLETAVDRYRVRLSAFPHEAGTWANLGIALKQLGCLPDAEDACRRALALDPHQMNGGNNLGIVLAAQHRHEEAVRVFRSTLSHHHQFHEAWLNFGLSLAALGEIGEATAAFGRATSLAPDYTEAIVQFVYHKLSCCDWTRLDEAIGRMSRAIRDDQGEVNPFALLPICRDPWEMLRAAQRYAARVERGAGLPCGGASKEPANRMHAKLRVGYASADFHQHATAVLAAELFEKHDRSRFEIVGYSFGPETGDVMRARLRAAFDHFVDVATLSNAEAAATIQRDGIDVLVDLKGYTRGARTAIYAMRPAPIQVNYLGYPGTMGARWMDYLVADHSLVPRGAEHFYTEKIVRLPGSYQCNDSTRLISASVPSRASLGLPDEATVLCCFNQPYKITPDVFDIWMLLLREVPDSVLWLLAFNREAPINLRRLASARNVDPARLVFAPKLPIAEHLARLSQADLFLDTHPCAAHTTASDALWAGVPVLTVAGQTFQSRVAASLLIALGQEGLVAQTLRDYHARARALAQARGHLSELKMQLLAARKTNDLFSGAAIARKLEAAYEAMWVRHVAGQPPDHLNISVTSS